MKLLVQQYLQHNSFGSLAKEHNIDFSFSKNKKKCSLNYSQFLTKNDNVLSWDCRGLILAKADLSPFATLADGKIDPEVVVGETVVLNFGFKRFFNFGHDVPQPFDWNDSKIKVQTKIDGTCSFVYFDLCSNLWAMGTRSSPDADIIMNNDLFTFRTLFDKALAETCGLSFDEFTSKLDKRVTYCFELTTPYNKIVVDYKACGVTLLTARNLDTLKEYDLDEFKWMPVPIVEHHPYTSPEKLIAWINTLPPDKNEGLVLCDSNHNRKKMKSEAYTFAHHAIDSLGCSNRNCVSMILSEKEDDVIPFLPEEIVKNLLRIKEGVANMIQVNETGYREVKTQADKENPGNKKTFAMLLLARKELWAAPLFLMFSGKISTMKDFFEQQKEDDGSWNNPFLDHVLEKI